MFFNAVAFENSMRIQSRSTIAFLVTAGAVYLYDRGILALVAVILALLILLLDLEPE